VPPAFGFDVELLSGGELAEISTLRAVRGIRSPGDGQHNPLQLTRDLARRLFEVVCELSRIAKSRRFSPCPAECSFERMPLSTRQTRLSLPLAMLPTSCYSSGKQNCRARLRSRVRRWPVSTAGRISACCGKQPDPTFTFARRQMAAPLREVVTHRSQLITPTKS
jgi:hypothetical protein